MMFIFHCGRVLLKLFACFLNFFAMTQAFPGAKGFRVFREIPNGGLLRGVATWDRGILHRERKLYWTRITPNDEMFFGPYVNPNHFAGFVELLLPMGMALLAMRGVRRDLIPLAGYLPFCLSER